MTLREQIGVMKAASAGANIEFTNDGIHWEIVYNPSWDWEDNYYRVAHDIYYKIRVMEAFLDGALIETITSGDPHPEWKVMDILVWDWEYNDYRVKV